MQDERIPRCRRPVNKTKIGLSSRPKRPGQKSNRGGLILREIAVLEYDRPVRLYHQLTVKDGEPLPAQPLGNSNPTGMKSGYRVLRPVRREKSPTFGGSAGVGQKPRIQKVH